MFFSLNNDKFCFQVGRYYATDYTILCKITIKRDFLAKFFQPNQQQAGPGGRPQNKNKHRINDEIRGKEFRVIDPDGKTSVVTRNEAMRMAEEFELDLVEIAPQAKPPVCKIIDYGKFVYELQKREKQQKRQQQQQQMKEIRFKWRTDTHDFNFKVKHARQFIEDGNKVKATVMFRGREITHKDIGAELLTRFVEEMIDIAKLDVDMKSEGKSMYVIMTPAKKKA